VERNKGREEIMLTLILTFLMFVIINDIRNTKYEPDIISYDPDEFS